MPVKNIVIGQHVNAVKVQTAKQNRRKMTPDENVLWQCLRRNQLGYHFRRQQVIDGFIVDFYCHAAGLVIEIEGGIHEIQEDYDEYRSRILSGRGLYILHISNSDVRSDLSEVLHRIGAACRARIQESHSDSQSK